MESTFLPDDTRRQRLEGFINTVCVGSTGRLGIVTHVAVSYGQWTACGFGLDGKGIWTSKEPTEIATAQTFFNKLNDRFAGRLSAHDCLSNGEVDHIAKAVFAMIAPGIDALRTERDTFEPIDINNITPEGFAQLREEVTSQVEAGVDNLLGLGSTVEDTGPVAAPNPESQR